MINKISFLIIFCIILFSVSFSNETILNNPTSDSVDLSIDSTKTNLTNYDSVNYSAEYFEFFKEENIIHLFNKASVTYGKQTISADTIIYYLNDTIVEAKGSPTLNNGEEIIHGKNMYYHFGLKKGRIEYASFNNLANVYTGNLIGYQADKSIFVSDGTFSSCDLDSGAHYYFFGEKIKMLANDKIMVKPLVLNIADVPVAALPFFIFPSNKGRHSGILSPKINITDKTGSLRNLGYYFAINDYSELQLSADIFSESGYLFKRVFTSGRYMFNSREKRLNMNVFAKSEISQSYENSNNNWELKYGLNWNVYPDNSLRISGNGRMLGSNSYYREDFSTNQNDFLKRRLHSDLGISKSWTDLGASANIKISQDKDLDKSTTTENLPSFRFSLNSRSLPFVNSIYKRDKRVFLGKKQKQVSTDSLHVLEKIKWNYGMNFSNKRYSYLDFDTTSIIDSSLLDTFTIDSSARTRLSSDMNHSFGLSYSPSPKLSYINISPSFSASSRWFFRRQDSIGIDTNNYNIFDTIMDFGHIEDWRTGVSLNTRLYGISMLNIGRLGGFRHTLSPSLGFSYSPKLDSLVGFLSTGGIVSTGRIEQKNMNLSFGNLFQMKILKDLSDSNSKDKNINLGNLNFSTSYNWADRDGLGKWSDLSASASTNLLAFNLSFRGNFKMYDSDTSFYLTKSGSLTDRLPELSNYNMNLSTKLNLSGTFYSGDIHPTLYTPDTSKNKNWNANFGFNYRYMSKRIDNSEDFSITKDFSLSNSFSIYPTYNLSLSYSSKYNFMENKIEGQSINFYRDFHCWGAIFNWVIDGYSKGYYFKINIKEIPDIKFEKRKGELGRFDGGSSYF